MLCRAKAATLEEAQNLYTDLYWLAEIKYDGIRVCIYHSEHSDGPKILTTSGRDITSRFPHIVAEMVKMPWGRYDGELMGGSLERINSLVNSYSPGDPILSHLVLFDFLSPAHTFAERRNTLRNALAFAKPVAIYQANLLFPHLNTLGEIKELGYEGLVFKRLGAMYRDLARSSSVIKYKFTYEVAVELGKRLGPKKFEIQAYNSTGTMTLLGSVSVPKGSSGDWGTVECLGLAVPSGKLREPRAWKPGADAANCTPLRKLPRR